MSINLIFQLIGDDRMTETQTLRFDTKTLKDLIMKYYKDYFHDDSIKIEYDVIEEDDYSYGRVVVKIIRNIKMGEYNVESKNTLFNEDIIKVINFELLNYNKKVQCFNYVINGTAWDGVSVILEDKYVKKKELRKE